MIKALPQNLLPHRSGDRWPSSTNFDEMESSRRAIDKTGSSAGRPTGHLKAGIRNRNFEMDRSESYRSLDPTTGPTVSRFDPDPAPPG